MTGARRSSLTAVARSVQRAEQVRSSRGVQFAPCAQRRADATLIPDRPRRGALDSPPTSKRSPRRSFRATARPARGKREAMAGLGYTYRWGEILGVWRYLDYDLDSGSAFESVTFSGPGVRSYFPLLSPSATNVALAACSTIAFIPALAAEVSACTRLPASPSHRSPTSTPADPSTDGRTILTRSFTTLRIASDLRDGFRMPRRAE